MFSVLSAITDCLSAIKSLSNNLLGRKQDDDDDWNDFDDYFGDEPDANNNFVTRWMANLKASFRKKKTHPLTGNEYSMYHECSAMTKITKKSKKEPKVKIVYLDDCSTNDDHYWTLYIDGWMEQSNLKQCPYCYAPLEPWENQVTIE